MEVIEKNSTAANNNQTLNLEQKQQRREMFSHNEAQRCRTV